VRHAGVQVRDRPARFGRALRPVSCHGRRSPSSGL
jgi:hypothetical protein